MATEEHESHNESGLTSTLRRAREGDAHAFAEAYRESRKKLIDQLDRQRMASINDPMVVMTAVFDTVFRGLINGDQSHWPSQDVFIAQMRSGIRKRSVSNNRKRIAKKRGGKWKRTSIEFDRLTEPGHRRLCYSMIACPLVISNSSMN